MSFIVEELSKAILLPGVAEGGDLAKGKFVMPGSGEFGVAACSGATSNFCGVITKSNKEDGDVEYAYSGAILPVTSSEAVARHKRLFLDATGQKVTDTLPTVAGKYISPGISLSSTSGDNKKLSMYVDPQEYVLNSDLVPEGSTNVFLTSERIDDRVAALIQDGDNITWTYDDTAGTLTGDVDLTP